MTNERVQPPTLVDTAGLAFSRVIVQTTARTAHIAGQTAWNRDRAIVGGTNIGLQARQGFRQSNANRSPHDAYRSLKAAA